MRRLPLTCLLSALVSTACLPIVPGTFLDPGEPDEEADDEDEDDPETEEGAADDGPGDWWGSDEAADETRWSGEDTAASQDPDTYEGSASLDVVFEVEGTDAGEPLLLDDRCDGTFTAQVVGAASLQIEGAGDCELEVYLMPATFTFEGEDANRAGRIEGTLTLALPFAEVEVPWQGVVDTEAISIEVLGQDTDDGVVVTVEGRLSGSG